MRLGLSVAVIAMHSFVVSYGVAADLQLWASPAGPVFKMILPMFFALSGYLVTGSFQRSRSLLQFLGLRVIRIYPALSVEVLLSAFLLGPLLTTLPPGAYFGNAMFFAYIANVTGHIHYLLPGVFTQNPYPDIVNAQLWTVPFELFCYLSLAALMILGIKRHPWLAFTAGFGVSVIYLVAGLALHHGQIPDKIGAVHGVTLVSAFLFGVGIYLYHRVLPWNRALCLLSGLLALALMAVPHGEYVAALCAAYFTVSLGLGNPAKLWLIRGADYSYGVFLYGFVVQQTIVALLPGTRLWWANIILSVPVAMLIAAISWHLVERPALRLKAHLPTRLPAVWRRHKVT
jgi:peptidoglycan/LPS O-acetylase OafA/YrhL